jgi:hypothetical protein
MIVDIIDYTPATLKDSVNFPTAFNAFTDLPLRRHFRTRRTSIPAGRATNDGMREYETNDNNVVKRSHVADYRTPTRQIPSRDRFRCSKVTEDNQRNRVNQYDVSDLLAHSPRRVPRARSTTFN